MSTIKLMIKKVRKEKKNKPDVVAQAFNPSIR